MRIASVKNFKILLSFAVGLVLAGCEDASAPPPTLPAFANYVDQDIELINGPLKMTLVPNIAARISQLQIADHHILMPVSDKPWRWGNVLWSSPQQEWGWPPPAALDTDAYRFEIDEESLLFTSEIDSRTGYQFTKRYRLHDDAIRITYTITNHSKEIKSVAPLELTRVPPSGDVVFPLGNTAPVSGIFYPLKMNIEQGLCWFSYDAALMTAQDHYKMMLDGAEGWLAYRSGDRILIKQFKDVDTVVEDEREIELFAHSDKTYLEIKHQGTKRRLGPGKSLSWSVYWRGLVLPEHLQGAIAPEELADFVRKHIHRDL